MVLLDLEYPPVLTPHTIARLNGRLEPNARQTLLALIRKAIKTCFVPFARYRGADVRPVLQRSIEKYSFYRLVLLRRLLEILGPDALQHVCRLLKEHVDSLSSEDWTRIGADSRRVRALFESYFRTISRFLKDPARVNAWPSPASPAFIRLVESLWAGASALDFCLTALVLAVEGEIDLPRPSVRALLGKGRWAVRHVSVDLQALCRRPRRLEEYFYQLLVERGLVVPFDTADDTGETAGNFEPIAVRGEPVSRTLLRDRR